jgi:hypothetical protein
MDILWAIAFCLLKSLVKRRCKFSLRLSNFRMPYNLASLSIERCKRIIEGWRELNNLIPHETHHSSRSMRTYHTHFGVPLGIVPGCWDDRKRNHKHVLSLPSLGYFQQSQPCTFLPSPFWPLLPGPKNASQQERPYEPRICDTSDWHTV